MNPSLVCSHYAASKNHTDVFDLLVSHGANMSLTNEMFQTPLHRAATLGHLPIVKKLISDEAGSANSGVKINAKDKMWNTPLHLACESGHGGKEPLVWV